ncbi:hypothetical protein KSP39_PZI019399 [Platanthera zijinensis]|uniref:Riboflavin synthase n=1 Tax=Platanthera zijinensis TaxID=2320716 RepID=A0AAP0FXL1_9ASPA
MDHTHILRPMAAGSASISLSPLMIINSTSPSLKKSRYPIIFHSVNISTKTQFKSAPIPLKRAPSLKMKNTRSTIKSLFTGIVEEVGEIRHLGPNQEGGIELRIAAKTVLGGIQLGDSISVNGTCLTVSDFDPAASQFSVGLSPETLRKTSMGELGPSSPVNLERALQPTSRMGGHIVQGHVDGTGEIVKFEPEGDSLWVLVKTSPELLRYIVPKGFISVDGTSLTVVCVYDKDNCFDFMLVEYTQQKIVIPMKKPGDKVNLEVDILGKYVERLLKNGIQYGVTSDAS